MPGIRVLVHGAAGRMGREVLNALARDPEIEPVCGVDIKVKEGDVLAVADGAVKVPLSSALEQAILRLKPQVVVDFSVAEATRAMAPVAAKHGVNIVIGTTGLTPQDVATIEGLCKSHNIGAMVAPNFALGAVLMMHMAKIASKYFDYAEVIELHHETKVDAPSGTAIATARAMAEARGGKPFQRNVPQKETLAGTRTGQQDGVTIHSVRLPGLVAHQEVIFGTLGQTLSIRHDTVDRQCFMPGVLLAVKTVARSKGFIYGLDKLLGLG